jgi:hypothetical protein
VKDTKTLEFERKQVASDLANEPDWEDEEPRRWLANEASEDEEPDDD